MPRSVDNDLDTFIRTEVLKLEEQFGQLAEKQMALQSLMSKVHTDVVSLLSHSRAEVAEDCNSIGDGDLSWEPVSANPGSGGGSVTALPPVTAVHDTPIHTGYVSAMVREVLYKIEQQELELQLGTKGSSLWNKYKSIEHEGRLKVLEMLLDSTMGAVILLNALFLGLQLDYRDTSVAWTVVDALFSVAFALELTTKIVVRGGLSNYFCGHDCWSNTFDVLLVLTDAVQLFLEEIWDADRAQGSPSASLFRVVRLIRLTRLVRLLRSEKFKSLLTMIQGILDGLMTLGWAIILFLLIVYVTALLSREAFGRSTDEEQGKDTVCEYFKTVPRSLFTIFRCSFGDCTTDLGTPLFEHIAFTQGWFATFCCSGFLFFMVMGLFNVISAIFVDTTMQAAAAASVSKQLARLEDEGLWATSVSTIIRNLLFLSPEHKHLVEGGMLFWKGGGSGAEHRDTENVISELFDVGIHTSVMDSVVLEQEVVEALQALDIDASDHKKLSDILDPDHSGRITILELVEGLQRLRGQPRRSDTVMVDLMIRTMQRNIEDIQNDVHTIAQSFEHVDLKVLASSLERVSMQKQLDLYHGDGGETELSI